MEDNTNTNTNTNNDNTNDNNIKIKRVRKSKKQMLQEKNNIQNLNLNLNLELELTNTSNENIVIINDNNAEHHDAEETQTEKVYKKRGRKPKGGKIIVENLPTETVFIPKPNVIMHLKCGVADLVQSQFISSITYNPSIQTVETFQFGNELGYDIISSNDEQTVSDIMTNNTNMHNKNNMHNNMHHNNNQDMHQYAP